MGLATVISDPPEKPGPQPALFATRPHGRHLLDRGAAPMLNWNLNFRLSRLCRGFSFFAFFLPNIDVKLELAFCPNSGIRHEMGALRGLTAVLGVALLIATVAFTVSRSVLACYACQCRALRRASSVRGTVTCDLGCRHGTHQRRTSTTHFCCKSSTELALHLKMLQML